MSRKINPGATDGRTHTPPGATVTEARPDDPVLLREQLHGVAELFEQAPGCMVLFAGLDHVVQMANPAYLALTGLGREIVGRPAREGLKRGYERGFGRLLGEVWASGQPKVVRSARLSALPVDELYGRDGVYAVNKRQLSRREIADLGLPR